MADQPVISFQNVFFALESGLQVFSGLNLDLAAGERCILSGTSRSGSSFFARLALGLFRPFRGTVRVMGVDVSHIHLHDLQEIRQHIGFVFRDSRLISNMGVERNIPLPLNYHRKLPPDVVRKRVNSLLDLFGLDPVQDIRPVGLSPEQRMLSALARSAVMTPEVLFFDDPLTGFPPDVSLRLLTAMKRLREWIVFHREDDQPPAMLIPVSEPGPYEGFADRFGTFQDGRVSFGKQEFLNL